MEHLKTIPAALEAAATRAGAGFTFITDDGREQPWSFEALLTRAKEIAVALRERGMQKGDRIALVLPTADEFIPTFLGVTQGGGVPVPLYPPMGLGQLGGYLEHCQHIVRASRATLLVTNGTIKAVLGTVREAAPELKAVITHADLVADAAHFRDPGVGLDDISFIQFTSGSTSRPKGVVLTHRNLAENARAIMRDGLSTDGDDRGVSWLPLFHDMGLIGFVIAPIHHRVPVSFMSPMTFLKKPSSWLKLLSQHRGTITYGPNFAYAITAKRVRDSELEGIDLSHVRVAGCGAEPIQAETLRAFAKRFAPYGFREDAFVPSYGMAENTLAISFARGIPTDRVRGEVLWTEGRAEPVSPGDGTSDAGSPAGELGAAAPAADDVIEIVGCGGEFPGHGIRIVDTETGEALPERRVGEIMISGPSLTAGYFDDPEKTKEAITDDGWLRTGDLGYLADGQIYICGRKKDVIIINGKNYYPQDLEWAASNVDGIRTGNVVAFPSFRQALDREAVVMVAETREPGGHDELTTKVKTEVHRVTGLMVDEVQIVPAGTIPKTSSGKVQRAKTRTLYEAGELKQREAEGATKIAQRVVQSQLAHLKLSIFGSRK